MGSRIQMEFLSTEGMLIETGSLLGQADQQKCSVTSPANHSSEPVAVQYCYFTKAQSHPYPSSSWVQEALNYMSNDAEPNKTQNLDAWFTIKAFGSHIIHWKGMGRIVGRDK